VWARSRYGAGGVRNVIGKPLLRLLPSCQVQPFGAPLRAARARANRSARSGCARQYESIASRGVGGMNGRLRARASTAGGKIAGNFLERRASACLFLSAFSSSHLDISGLTDEAIIPSTRKAFVTVASLLWAFEPSSGLYTVRKKTNIRTIIGPGRLKLMAKSHLKLVTPAIKKRTVAPKRRRNGAATATCEPASI